MRFASAVSFSDMCMSFSTASWIVKLFAVELNGRLDRPDGRAVGSLMRLVGRAGGRPCLDGPAEGFRYFECIKVGATE